jgi:putative transposase
MKRRFTVREKIRILREADSGLTVADLCRKHNISEQTFYNWRRKYGSMDISEAERLRDLEKENARLKKKLAETVLELDMAKEVISKKW